MKPVLSIPIIFLITVTVLMHGCCPPPCYIGYAIGPSKLDPGDFIDPSVPTETEEFLFYKGKGGSLHNSTNARKHALDNVYEQIFNSISKGNIHMIKKEIIELVITGVIIIEEHNVKSITPYSHRRKNQQIITVTKFEVIIIARYPKLEYLKVLRRINNKTTKNKSYEN